MSARPLTSLFVSAQAGRYTQRVMLLDRGKSSINGEEKVTQPLTVLQYNHPRFQILFVLILQVLSQRWTLYEREYKSLGDCDFIRTRCVVTASTTIVETNRAIKYCEGTL